jgi:RNA polymerase sigma-70 factor (ECF subfamily)
MLNTDQPGLPPGESLAPLRGYLLFVAEQHLGRELHAKGGASDLVQATLLNAHRSRRQFRGESDEEYRGWLRRILLNLVRKFRRRWLTQSRDCAREVPLQEQAGGASPSHLARQAEQREQLARALALLPEEQQRAIALRFEDGLSFAEVGARLGKTAEAARKVYHRALERLQALLLPRDD